MGITVYWPFVVDGSTFFRVLSASKIAGKKQPTKERDLAAGRCWPDKGPWVALPQTRLGVYVEASKALPGTR
jgi:hypothetical protein